MLTSLIQFSATVTLSTVLIAGAIGQAHAAITINGGGENGLIRNGFSTNGTGDNGSGENGGGTNGTGENGVAFGLKSFAIDGIQLPTGR